MSVGKLILANKFEQACAEADLELASVGWEKTSQMWNKAIALLKLDRPAEAEALCEMIRLRKESRYETSGESIILGVAQWLQNNRAAAIEAWRRATSAPYTDMGGGVEPKMLLIYAAKAQGLPDLEAEALRMLTKLTRLNADLKMSNSRPGWPRPLAEFALGHLTTDEVREIISNNSDERLRPLLYKQSCQAEFYFGVFSKDASQRKEHLWRAAFDYVPDSYFLAEHHLASFEFKVNSTRQP